MFDHLIMPPRAGYAVITTNDFMVIVRDTGDIVSVLEDADAVLEHLSLTASQASLCRVRTKRIRFLRGDA